MSGSPKLDLAARLTIEQLGQRGEGIARTDVRKVFVPYALPGETVIAEVDGERGRLAEILTPSPERIAAFCPYYTICGGCAVQALAPDAYKAWKRDLVVSMLRHAKLEAEVSPLRDAHGAGRRRATFHIRYDAKGNPQVGFMQARAHEVIDLFFCPVLSPGMAQALPAARALAESLASSQKPIDMLVTESLSGLDIDIRGHGPLNPRLTERLIEQALELGLARLSNHSIIVVERLAPVLRMGRAELIPPPGAFLQATLAGEETLAALVRNAIGSARHIADLFCGVGTFTLRLAESSEVHSFDAEAPALAALSRAARNTQGLHQVKVETRDLMRRPLTPGELGAYDAVVFDPPRAGADAQAQSLAKSKVPIIVAVSCNAQTFARDAATLVQGGYTLESTEPIDQFRHSPHVEIVAVFRRKSQPRKRPRLLG
jgi:23S rRNA (uracil1939-C5)-methyltransferase